MRNQKKVRPIILLSLHYHTFIQSCQKTIIGMMIRFLTLSTVLAISSASMVNMEKVDIPMNSEIGSRLMSKARRLNGDDDGIDFTWVKNYSLKFDSCHTTFEFRPDGGKSGDEEDAIPGESQLYVQFKLCPSESCNFCRNGADYLVELREFLESYINFQEELKEYNCERLKNNCACDDDQNQDDQNCFAQCYMAADMSYCEDYDSGDGNDDDYVFELDEYLECSEVEDNDDDSNILYIGPMCSKNGQSIYLGEFQDRQCSKKATKGTYEALTGKSLPYTSTSLVSRDCISCEEPVYYDDDANQNQNNQGDNEDGIREFCQELYEGAAKCEKNLKNVDYKYTGGCEYIHKMLPQAERMATGSVSTSTVFAWIFGISTVALSVYAFLMYRRLKRAQVSLFSEGNN